MLLHSGARGVEAIYIEDFGVLFAASVNFPLLPPPATKEKESEPLGRNPSDNLLSHMRQKVVRASRRGNEA